MTIATIGAGSLLLNVNVNDLDVVVRLVHLVCFDVLDPVHNF